MSNSDTKNRENNGTFKKGFSYSVPTQFKKGQNPHNKGISKIPIRSCETCKIEWKPRFLETRFCSRKCYGIFSTERQKKDKIETVCNSCNSTYMVFPYRDKETKYCGFKCYWKSLQESKKGANCIFWKGGIVSIKTAIRGCREYKEWRKAVFQRDDYTCKDCGIKGCELNADHVKPFAIIYYQNNIQSLEDALNCAEFWNINNGRTLCVPCHKKTDTYLKPYKLIEKQLYV